MAEFWQENQDRERDGMDRIGSRRRRCKQALRTFLRGNMSSFGAVNLTTELTGQIPRRGN